MCACISIILSLFSVNPLIIKSYSFSELDGCVPNPCGNGATCTNVLGDYTCTCAPGWKGVNCTEGEKKITYSMICRHVLRTLFTFLVHFYRE